MNGYNLTTSIFPEKTILIKKIFLMKKTFVESGYI